MSKCALCMLDAREFLPLLYFTVNLECDKVYQCVLVKINISGRGGFLVFKKKEVEYFFLIKVTEIEIEKGILKADFKSQSAMVFHREIQGFTNFEDRMTKRHIDTSTEDGKVWIQIFSKLFQL